MEVKTVLKCASQSTLESKKRQKYKKSERQTLSHYAPFEEMLPSSYCLIKITSTKSRGAMMPIAAEGVTVRQIEMSCTRVDDKGTYSIKLNKEQIWSTFWYQFIQKVFTVLYLVQPYSKMNLSIFYPQPPHTTSYNDKVKKFAWNYCKFTQPSVCQPCSIWTFASVPMLKHSSQSHQLSVALL